MRVASHIRNTDTASLHRIKGQSAQEISRYPLVSVGLPTYNGATKIGHAVMSVLDQGYPNLEIVISDNGSTDNTEEVCREFIRTYPCIKYFRQPENMGVMPNFRFVLAQAAGDLFMWMSDDDALHPGILPQYVAFLMNNPGYSLVSGQIKYWIGDQAIFCEKDFSIEHKSGGLRFLSFYFKVVYGSIFYGLMHTQIARKIPLNNRVGGDWHFIAGVAYLGKIKNLDCIGYHKKCGGISRNFKQYGKTMGATSFAAKFPYIQIAIDAFSNILYHSPVYAGRHHIVKTTLGVCAFLSVVINFYGKRYPFIVGGRIKRFLGLRTSSAKFRTA